MDRGRAQRLPRGTTSQEVPHRRLPGARGGGEVPDRFRRTPAAHHVRRQEAVRGEGRPDAEPAQPHDVRQGRHLRARLRQHRRGDPAGLPTLLPGIAGHADRSECALQHEQRPVVRAGAVRARDGRLGDRAAQRCPGQPGRGVREPSPGGRPLDRLGRGAAGGISRHPRPVLPRLRLPGPGDAVHRPVAGEALPVRQGAAHPTARPRRGPHAADQ